MIGARLIKELDSKLKQVETEVRDAFKELDEKDSPLQEK
jgi:exodeoxyribonuclease VII small subunit